MSREKIVTETRYIRQISFDSLDYVKRGKDGTTKCEEELNDIIDELKEKGAKIVSIVPHTVGISPIHLVYDIIYSAEHRL